MFDEPSGVDTWYVAEAQLRDGSRVDVLKAGAPINEDKPNRLYASFRNHRWKMIYTMLSHQGMSADFGKELAQLKGQKQEKSTILNQLEREMDRLKEVRADGSPPPNLSTTIAKLEQEMETTRGFLAKLNERERGVLYGTVYRDGLVNYLRREWNERHPPEKQIIVLNLRVYIDTRPPGLDWYKRGPGELRLR